MTDQDPSRRPFELPLGARRIPEDVTEELRFHLEERIEELMAEGLSRSEAEAEARARFGNLPAIGAQVMEIDQRKLRRRSVRDLLETLTREIRFALRALSRHPGLTTAAVLTLGLGIGANTALFSTVDGVLLHPLDVPGLDRLVILHQNAPGLKLMGGQLSPPMIEDLAQIPELFEAVGGIAGTNLNLTSSGEPQRIVGARTMGRFFDVFAVQPALGRLYRPEDSENGNDRVAVITDGLWRSWAGGDPNVIGRTIELDGTSFQVIGVLPAGFRYRPTIQVYTPMVITAQVRAQRGVWGTSALARLRPGVSPAQFTAGLDRISKVWQADPARANDADAHWFLSGKSLVAAMAGELRALLELLMVAVLLVLVIACANVANLQLLRATAREKELAVRAAMGAGKWPIVRQLLMESGLLSLAGGILGLGLGVALIHLLRELGSGPLPALHNVRLDPSVLVFTAAATLCSALLFGVAPALRAARADLQGVLRDTSRNASAGPGRNRLLRTSVAAQMALSLLLLLGAGLLIRSLTQLVKIDPGFQPSHLLTFQVALPRARYAEPPQRAAFFGQLLTRLATQPSIDAVGAISDLPFGQGRNSSPFTIAGKPTAPGEPDRHADMRFVEGDYFKAAGIPLIRGRAFSSLDGDQAVPLSAIIDESLARQYFGSDDPIGQTISQGPSAVIVGVVGAVKHGDLTEADKPTVYYPYHQAPWYSGLYLAVRTRQATDVVVAEAKAAVRELDSTLPIFDVVSMQQRVDDSLGARRVAMLVLTGLAGLALLLALLGIYGVMSYTTSRRTHELGIRLALGAVPGDVVRMVLQEGMMLAGIGLLAGLASFLFLARLLTSILYGVSPRDPFTIAAGIGTLLLGTVVAALLPARRAARVDPMETLREQ